MTTNLYSNLPDPNTTDQNRWFNELIAQNPIVPLMPPGAGWKPWAVAATKMVGLGNQVLPDPYSYDDKDWRGWATAFKQAVET